MRKANIVVTLNGQVFATEFDITDETKEYQIADEAYRLGLLFAETQLIAKYGSRKRVSSNQFAETLRNLDYTYSIQEIK